MGDVIREGGNVLIASERGDTVAVCAFTSLFLSQGFACDVDEVCRVLREFGHEQNVPGRVPAYDQAVLSELRSVERILHDRASGLRAETAEDRRTKKAIRDLWTRGLSLPALPRHPVSTVLSVTSGGSNGANVLDLEEDDSEWDGEQALRRMALQCSESEPSGEAEEFEEEVVECRSSV